MWQMDAFRESILKILGQQFDQNTAAHQVQLALEHRIESWVVSGLTHLVERAAPLLASEMKLLGLNVSAKVIELREKMDDQK
jgi:hypothetical protein